MFKIFQKQAPDYKTIEIEAELDKTKDELIAALNARISDLETILRLTNSSEALRNHIMVEESVQTSEKIKTRPVYNTTSQLAHALELKSMQRAENVRKIDVGK